MRPEFLIIKDLGNDEHAIDINEISSMSTAVPRMEPEELEAQGFTMGSKDIVSIYMHRGHVYFTRETLDSLIQRIARYQAQP
jgi:hypothetical protein